MQKTDTTKSPLLKPVIERDYTQGISLNDVSPAPEPQSPKTEPAQDSTIPQDDKPPRQEYNIPHSNIADETREFAFDDMPEAPSDISDGDHSDGVNISAASAKTFANFAGDALQLYLPKLTYGYCKIDMENVIVNVQAGKLTTNWIDTFELINNKTEEALKISDDAIKMWKKAFKDYLESENIAFANPKTAFILATIVLLADQGVKAYQIRKSNEEYMKQALEASNPGLFAKQKENPVQTAKEDSGNGTGADKKAA